MTPAELLARSRVIAVVGMSTHPAKPAHTVPVELLRRGWTIIPVHRTATEIAGQRAYPTLADVPVPVDLVNVFRPSAEAADVVAQALAIGAGGIWLQQGITSAAGRRLADAAGVPYVEDACTAVVRAVHQVAPPT